MYYTVIEKLAKVFDEEHRNFPADTSSKEAFLEWQNAARQKLRDIIKLDKFDKCDLKSQVLESVPVDDDLTREKVLIQVEEGVYMPMYVLIPNELKGKKDARILIAMSGHAGGGMMSVAGIRDNELVNQAIAKFNYDYGYKMAKKGYVVFCPETRGFGERREAAMQNDESILLCTCYHLARMAYGLGLTLMGMQVFDVMRLVDYICERGEFDTDNINILGFSGGGLQALYTSALDERIKNVIVSGYMYGYKEALFEKNGNFPGARLLKKMRRLNLISDTFSTIQSNP